MSNAGIYMRTNVAINMTTNVGLSMVGEPQGVALLSAGMRGNHENVYDAFISYGA